MTRMDTKPDRGSKPGKDGLSKYAYYSGLGFQMIAIIAVFTFIGVKLDDSAGSERPLWAALFSLLGVGISLYSVIRSVNRKEN